MCLTSCIGVGLTCFGSELKIFSFIFSNVLLHYLILLFLDPPNLWFYLHQRSYLQQICLLIQIPKASVQRLQLKFHLSFTASDRTSSRCLFIQAERRISLSSVILPLAKALASVTVCSTSPSPALSKLSRPL